MATTPNYQPIVSAVSELVLQSRKNTLDELLVFLNDKAEVDDELKALIEEFKSTLEIPTPAFTKTTRPAKKAKRAPSQYNTFIGEAMRQIKAEHPEMTSVQRMKAATEKWKVHKTANA